jgi:hypothetical protein
MNRMLLLAAALTTSAPAALAQQPFGGSGPWDPAVPSPRAVLGYEPGQRFTPHAQLGRYLERLAATSHRIRVDTAALTFEGREAYVVVVSSEANVARLDQIRADLARLADPRGASGADLAALAARTPATVWLGYTVHGGEASGTEAAIALLYQLAAGRDEETRMILDSTVVLIDPVQNPDGHERHVQDVLRQLPATGVPISPAAMVHQGSWPGPRTSHYYFDINRDWFILSHPETRGRVRAFQRWWPMAAVDLHEMGSSSTYYFAPPMAPVNKNVPESTRQWWEIYAAANIAAFDEHGWSFFRREGYDEFYPGYGVSWPILTGAVGMTYEEASSGGGAIRRTDGTVLTLHDAVWHHYTAAWATLMTTARRRQERVRDYLAFRQAAVADGERGPMRAVVFERDEQGRADSLAVRLLENGIELRRLRSAADSRDAVEYGESAPRPVRLAAGAYVVDLAQPQGRLAKALLEPDAELDSSFIREELESRRTGQGDRFYDITAWSLPLAFRLRAWWTHTAPPTGDPVALAELTVQAPRPAAPPNGRYGYAFRPGSEASLRLLAGLLRDSVRLWYAPHAFNQGPERFPRGAFVVRVQANGADVHEVVRRDAEAAGATVVALASAAADSGADLGSNSVVPVRSPRVALVGGAPVSGNSFGFAWYAFDQRLGYPVTAVSVQTLAGPRLDEFDVIVLPSVPGGAFDAALGESGRTRLADWVRGGGTLITIDAATAWLSGERLGLARLRLRRDTVRADSAGGAPLPSDVPGAIVRAYGDTLSPLLAGVRTPDIPVLVNSDRVYNAPRDLRAGEAVVHYAPVARLRLAGYLWPEMPARLAESVWLWTERVGRGRVIGFAGDPNFRDHFRGLLPLFANAVFLGSSM